VKVTKKMDTREELLASNSDIAVCVKKREDQLRRKARGLRTRAAKCIEVDVRIFEYLLWTVKQM
jgi:hypothetical protein